MMPGEGSEFPQVSFGQSDDQPHGGGQAANEEEPGSQQGVPAEDEVPPSTWLPTPPPSGGYSSGPQWGPNYTPGYGAGRRNYRRASGSRFKAGYQPGVGLDPDMGPVKTIFAFLVMRWHTRRRRTRRILWLTLVAAWAIAGAIIGVVANGSSGNSASSANWNPPSGIVKGTTGSALTLYGFQSAEKMNVTLTKVLADAQPGDQFSSPKAGDRLYAAQFRLTDTGSAAYSDSPWNGTDVVDSAGRSYPSAIMIDSVAGCQLFPAVENITAGDSGLGCIVFQVPKSAKIVAVKFTLDSGLAFQTGQWRVAG